MTSNIDFNGNIEFILKSELSKHLQSRNGKHQLDLRIPSEISL